MGAFCTRTICNIEKGDSNHQKLFTRNTEKIHPVLTPIATNTSIPQNDEIAVSAAYTHSMDSIQPHNGNASISKHVSVPTPSIQEIQHAMDNLHLFADPESDNDNDNDNDKESTPILPTMAVDASNFQLANPFVSLSAIQESNGSISSTTNINNVNILIMTKNKNEDDNIAMASTVASSIVIHPNMNQQNNELKLNSQLEGSSEQTEDDTNTVFPPVQIVDNNNNNNNKIKERNEELMRLNMFDGTTFPDESSSNDVDMMKAELEKLKIQNEIAEMNNAINYYRQQSDQL